jgi:hypothetical protein
MCTTVGASTNTQAKLPAHPQGCTSTLTNSAADCTTLISHLKKFSLPTHKYGSQTPPVVHSHQDICQDLLQHFVVITRNEIITNICSIPRHCDVYT